ncbi:MAG: Methyl-coenzyme M reductase, protein C [Candidatus Syntrophoarchaeum caldarius]|uniref:Methyl-coenzyme M reductase, protein C n=1 Tax=Candidatus Syntropharchaeum caldarium TaxID=1838285 RepID=A0A1F2P9E1_9EURY|nr:MAG: Methyl-coenzyme M reductase, protein C [Candidatus Syntrophoarchaeum caldarius]
MMPLKYIGNAFESDEIIEFIEDLGGFVLNIDQMGGVAEFDVMIDHESVNILRKRAALRKHSGRVITVPLYGIEVAVIIPSFNLHHTPFPHCSTVETLRQAGAKVNTIAPARGVGRKAILMREERMMIEEHDLAIFMFGCFEHCIREKMELCRRLNVPVIVTGYADLESDDELIFIPSITRIPTMFDDPDDKRIIGAFMESVISIIGSLRPDVPATYPYIKTEIESKFGVNVVLKMSGLRVNASYDEYAEKLGEMEFYFGKLGEFGSIKRGTQDDIIIELPLSVPSV